MCAIKRQLFCIQALALIVGLVHAHTMIDKKCAKVAPEERVECALPSASPEQCMKQGCCYDPSIPGAIACFAHRHEAVCKCSEQAPSKRLLCGFPGITFEQCRTIGCCYDPSITGAATCFKNTYLIIKTEKATILDDDDEGEPQVQPGNIGKEGNLIMETHVIKRNEQ
ncbi:hypothetical protein FKM82_008049 [Ascaphus truei]